MRTVDKPLLVGTITINVRVPKAYGDSECEAVCDILDDLRQGLRRLIASRIKDAGYRAVVEVEDI